VEAGSELANADFALSKTHTVRIRGRIINASGDGSRMVTLALIPTEPASGLRPSRTFVTNPQGAFDIRGVMPGVYRFVASIFDRGAYTTAKAEMDARSDIDDFTIALAPGVELAGQVRVDGEVQADLRSVRVSLLPSDPGEISVPLPNTQVNADGTFTLPNVSPDHYTLAAFDLPEGYYVKSIRLGNDEILDKTGLNVGAQKNAPITILLSPGAAEITGVVQNAQQQPAVGAFVTLSPRDEERRDQTQYYRSVTTDQFGRFLLRNVVPGPYNLFASEDLDMQPLATGDTTKSVELLSQPMVIEQNRRYNARLKLIPAEQSQRR
jgi:hypothetical protein